MSHDHDLETRAARNRRLYRGNPLHKRKGQWYFFDESWETYKGPYNTLREARRGYQYYCESLGDNDWDDPLFL